MTPTPSYGWQLGLALVVLVGFGGGVSVLGGLRVTRQLVAAALRAVAQLAAVSLVIATVMERTSTSLLFATAMFAVAAATAAGRVEARGNVAWVAVSLAVGALPILIIIFGLKATPFTGQAIIPIAGIVIGGAMTAHTLTARRAFSALRSDLGQVEAGLALGLTRPQAIMIVIARHAPEALTPILDQTRTVGLVTLPGAFVGVLLGGGSASEAAASQVLVLVGLLAAEATVVVASQRLIAGGRILPSDIRASLPVS